MKVLSKLSTVIFFLCSLFFNQISKAQTRSILHDQEEAVFTVFPNPNQNDQETFVSLKNFKAQDLLVVVYDMLGREIYSKVEVKENGGFLFTLSSNGKQLSTGVYLITASADDSVFRQKLIVK